MPDHILTLCKNRLNQSSKQETNHIDPWPSDGKYFPRALVGKFVEVIAEPDLPLAFLSPAIVKWLKSEVLHYLFLKYFNVIGICTPSNA